jgi:hypothetical protein
MNERIRELSKQAAEFVEENSVNWVPEEFEQKFAELIVAECNEVLRQVPYNSDRDFGDEAIYQEAINIHFRS